MKRRNKAYAYPHRIHIKHINHAAYIYNFNNEWTGCNDIIKHNKDKLMQYSTKTERRTVKNDRTRERREQDSVVATRGSINRKRARSFGSEWQRA